jgi:hypothetical protein
MNASRIEALCHDLCATLAEETAVAWRVRIAAAAIVLERFLDARPVVLHVRAAVYGRSAVFRLGGAMVPQHQGEIDHFREQVGPAMVLLGIGDGSASHAVLSIGGVMLELAHGADWNDRGVLLRPFARTYGGEEVWTVGGLRYGAIVSYECVEDAPFILDDGPAVTAYVEYLAAALRSVRARVAGL